MTTSALALGYGDRTTEMPQQTLAQLLVRLGGELTYVPENSPADNGLANASALQALVNQLQINGGGAIMVPIAWQADNEGHLDAWPITGNITIGGGDGNIMDNLKLIGVGSGSGFLKQDSTDFIDISNGGGNITAGGTQIADLQIRYVASATAGAALYYENGQEHRSHGLYFSDCPFGIVYVNELEGTTRDCKVDFFHNSNAVGVTVTNVAGQHNTGCNQILIDGYDILANAIPNNTSIGVLCNAANHLSIINSDIQQMGSGCVVFAITSTLQNDTVHSCMINVQASSSGTAAFLFTVSSPGSGFYDSRMDNCFAQSGNGSSAVNGNIVIGVIGVPNNLIDLFQISNTASSMSNAGWGWDINSGTNIRIVNCAAQGNQLGGMRIQGGTRLQLLMVDFCPQYQGHATTQPVALTIANASHVDVAFCDASGYGAAPITFGGGVTDARLYFNRGYNDQTTPVTATASCPNATPFGNQSFASAYWGPVRYWLSGAGSITAIAIANNALMLGAVTLPNSTAYLELQPYEWVKVTYTGTINVTAVGY